MDINRINRYIEFREYILSHPKRQIMTLENLFELIKKQYEIYWTIPPHSETTDYPLGGHARIKHIFDGTHNKKDWQITSEVISGRSLDSAQLIEDVSCFYDIKHPIIYVQTEDDTSAELKRMSMKLEL